MNWTSISSLPRRETVPEMVLPGRHLVSGTLIRIDIIARGKEVANVRGVCICVDWAYSELRNIKEAKRGRKREKEGMVTRQCRR